MLSKDVLCAGRTLRKSPAFTLTAVVTIALGIGASAAISVSLWREYSSGIPEAPAPPKN